MSDGCDFCGSGLRKTTWWISENGSRRLCFCDSCLHVIGEQLFKWHQEGARVRHGRLTFASAPIAVGGMKIQAHPVMPKDTWLSVPADADLSALDAQQFQKALGKPTAKFCPHCYTEAGPKCEHRK
jgi:hypothetical protein